MGVPLDIQQEVNNRITHALERGIEPWRRPFDPAPSTGRPANILSRRPYSGVNALLLDLHSIEHGLRSRWFGTKGDWRKFGACVMGGGCKIVTNGRYSVVHNAEEVAGSDGRFRVPGWPWRHIPHFGRAHRLIEATGADIRHNDERCMYVPPVPLGSFPVHLGGDYIEMPERHCFRHKQNFFYVCLHELGHWAQPRLGWDDWYDIGELIAEIVACSLCRDLGVPPWGGELDYEEHAAQLKTWVDFFKDDPRYVFDACEQASKTIDYLLSFNGDTDQTTGA